MAIDLTRKSDRARLASRREPYWTRSKIGLYLGYRVLADVVGTWIARQQ